MGINKGRKRVVTSGVSTSEGGSATRKRRRIQLVQSGGGEAQLLGLGQDLRSVRDERDLEVHVEA